MANIQPEYGVLYAPTPADSILQHTRGDDWLLFRSASLLTSNGLLLPVFPGTLLRIKGLTPIGFKEAASFVVIPGQAVQFYRPLA